ncbi:hypothetical protein BHE74_00057989 [Ensete ventricosum]|nr:hypothetical protein BHE74_00057989 [Ensete ventricosum]
MATAHCLSLLYKEGTSSSFSLSNDSKSTTAVLLSLPFKSIAHHLPLLLCWQRRLGCQPSLLAIATSVNLAATAALVSSSSAEISDATSRSVTASPLPPAAIVHLLLAPLSPTTALTVPDSSSVKPQSSVDSFFKASATDRLFLQSLSHWSTPYLPHLQQTTTSTSAHPLLLPRRMTEGCSQSQHLLPSPSVSSSSQDPTAGQTPLLPSSTNSAPICCSLLPAIAASIATKALSFNLLCFLLPLLVAAAFLLNNHSRSQSPHRPLPLPSTCINRSDHLLVLPQEKRHSCSLPPAPTRATSPPTCSHRNRATLLCITEIGPPILLRAIAHRRMHNCSCADPATISLVYARIRRPLQESFLEQ